MIGAAEFCTELFARGYDGATGVPCSYFSGPIAYLEGLPGRYVGAVNEGNALAIAVGSQLAGRRQYLMLQNSGLGNIINPLTSLAQPYGIGVLCFISLRGWPDPADDEPQHVVMGRSTHALLDAIGVHYGVLPAEAGVDELRALLDAAECEIAAGRPACILIEKGSVGGFPSTAEGANGLLSADVMHTVAELSDGCLVVASTGYVSRDLFTVADRPTHFYMQGSMGHASGIGLGLALAVDRTVVVVEGDGAALMQLGSWAAVGAAAPANLVHVVIDNGVHDSTGGQQTCATGVDFAGLSRGAGYLTWAACDDLAEFRRELARMLAEPGPHLCVVATAPREANRIPRRITESHTAVQVADRFRQAVRVMA